MRPQQKLFLVAALLLFATKVAVAGQFLQTSPIRDQMRKASVCENSLTQECHQQPDLRLASQVLQLSHAGLLSASKDEFPAQQLKCQKAIVRGSTAYVTHWIEAIEAGNTPEWADQFASRQLDAVSIACNVPVLQNSNGVTLPAAGGPCAVWTNQPFTNLDAESLRVCLHRTLEFWTSYLYIPEQQ